MRGQQYTENEGEKSSMFRRMDNIQSGKKKYIHKSLRAEALQHVLDRTREKSSKAKVTPPKHIIGRSRYSGKTYSHD